jgi:hypothetical protein
MGGSGVEGSVVGLRLGTGIVSILKFLACWSSLDQYASSSFSIALSSSCSKIASSFLLVLFRAKGWREEKPT